MTRQQRIKALARHMAECPFTNTFGRALWRALF